VGDSQAKYWEERYRKEGKIWGEKPCLAAVEAEKIFKEHRAKKILLPGCGYGRNAKYLARQGFEVTGMDISGWAVETAQRDAQRQALNITYRCADLLNTPSWPEAFEGLFTFNLLHLFGSQERALLAQWFHETLRSEGILVLTSMSLRDPDYGQGQAVAHNTFESKKGRPVFYFAEEDMRDLFQKWFQILRLEEIQEHEHHGGRDHFHWMWFLAGRKAPAINASSAARK